MKKLLIAVFALLFANVANAQNYVEGQTIGVPKSTTETQVWGIYGGMSFSVPRGKHKENTWHTINIYDFHPWLPKGIKAIRTDGIVIITHGIKDPEICDLHISFRHPTDKHEVFTIQAAESFRNGGIRAVAGRWIALDHMGRFQAKWTRNTPGNWPYHCSYGFNFRLGAWIR